MQIKNKVKNKRTIIIVVITILIISIFGMFLLKNNYKNLKVGNTMINKNIEEIEEYILNISSYDANIEITVESNKNTNQYIIEQQYTAPNISKQTVIEPSNIEGLQTIYNGDTLTIQNSKINASTIYEHYPYLADNYLWLNSFIEDYKKAKQNGDTKLIEENGIVIMETKVQSQENQYAYNKVLTVDRKTGKPTKLSIEDINKKCTVYILYNEITVNGLQKEEVLAFRRLNKILL